ncbi:FMRFamide-related peptides-like isoform X1 [Hylaeus anthracinus]|uniref:FMRFamide-related peptides-like isoform X1 n=1 Tax=Hylaeus anthracinus TaxID=313031 RepID=UPI0023B9F824|nr:FMRFamide-related peptides-like isoform X1 [Hylaeus anthracinus]
MSALSSLYVLPFLCNWFLVSSSMLTPLRADGNLRIFKDAPSDFEYVLKRHGNSGRSDDADSKERRSNVGSSSFIRFGRGDSEVNAEKLLDGEADDGSKVSRYPRWKSPDVVIRFGRSGYKAANRELKRGRNDLNFIRQASYGRNTQMYPLEIDLTAMCSDLMLNDELKYLRPYEARLLRLCNVLDDVDVEHRNSLSYLENRLDSKHE